MHFLDSVFKLSEHQTSLRKEGVAGLTSFAAMAYILAVNPSILSASGMDAAALVTVTALSAAMGCGLMAILANYPIALAPGMGMNAFFAFTLCQTLGIPWQGALGIVFWNGVLFMALSLSGIRERIIECVPDGLRVGVQAGIGLFIAFIGLSQAGLVVDHPATLVTLGDLGTPSAWLAIFGILVTGILILRKIPGGVLLAIVVIALLGCLVPGENGRVTSLPSMPFSLPPPPTSISFQLDLLYPINHWRTALPLVFAFLFVDLFDTLGTLLGVGRTAGLLTSSGQLPRLKSALVADAGATLAGALIGTSPVTAYVESAAGVRAGGRTGLTTLVVGLCFLLSLFLTPLILALPSLATGAALVVIGLTMAEGLRSLAFDDLAQTLPAFLTMLAMPLTASISDGIGLGFICYAGMMLGGGRAREVPLLTYGVAGLFLLRYAFL